MKIAKFTWLYNGNYGSVLQAVALQKFLENKGCDIVDLNYKASISVKLWNWFINHNSIDLVFEKYREKKNNKNIKDKEKFKLREEKFTRFKKENLKMSKMCRTPHDLKKISKEYDLFICGSDQIWSPKLMNPVFYFNFVGDNKIKAAYAPSFGVTDTHNFKKRKMKKMLQKFDYISIRETQGKELIKELIGKDVPVQVDPTMLLKKSEWEEYIEKEPIIKKKYIFCYLLTPNEEYINHIKKFAKEKDIEVVIVPTVKGPFNTGFQEYPDAGPSDWLNLIKNASYVFTDSFHGCIFSVIFHKEVFLYKRFVDDSRKSENSRIYTLTKWLGIEERLIDKKNMNKINEFMAINYEKVDECINFKVKESSEWIDKVIKESEQRIKNEKRK